MIMFTGKLTKVNELEGALYPNNRDVGEITVGDFIELPKVDCGFVIMNSLTRGLRTSCVREIVSETEEKIVFKTLNSLYELEYKIRD